jgi:hypothetical protein
VSPTCTTTVGRRNRTAALVVQGRALQVQGLKDGTNHHVFAGPAGCTWMVPTIMIPCTRQ